MKQSVFTEPGTRETWTVVRGLGSIILNLTWLMTEPSWSRGFVPGITHSNASKKRKKTKLSFISLLPFTPSATFIHTLIPQKSLKQVTKTLIFNYNWENNENMQKEVKTLNYPHEAFYFCFFCSKQAVCGCNGDFFQCQEVFVHLIGYILGNTNDWFQSKLVI